MAGDSDTGRRWLAFMRAEGIMACESESQRQSAAAMLSTDERTAMWAQVERLCDRYGR